MAKKTEELSRTAAVEEMIAAAADFYHFGWMMAASGNLSCRYQDDAVVVTSTRSHKRKLSPELFVDVDLDGKPAEKKAPAPSMDTAVHLAIYREVKEARAVYHVHHLSASLCSDRDKKQGFTHICDLEMLRAFGIDDEEAVINIPIVENALDRGDLVANIVEAIKNLDENSAPCVNIEHHGIYVWAESAEQARRHVEALGYLYDYSWRRPMNPRRSTSVSGFQT